MKLIRKPNGDTSRAGIALLWALFVAIVAGGSAFVMATLASSSKRISDVDRATTQAKALSRGATVFAEQALAEALQIDAPVPAGGTAVLNGAQVDWSLTALTPPVTQNDGSGLSSFVATWQIESVAEIDGKPVTSRRVVRSETTPIFQYALFYQNDMHFFYPAPMTVRGPVHCNADVYFWAHQDLTFDTNHFRVSGEVYGEAFDPNWLAAYPWGNTQAVDIRQWVPNPFDPAEPVAYGQLESVFDLDSLGITSSGGFDTNFAGYDSNGDGDWNDMLDVPPFGPGVFDKFGAAPGVVAPGAVSTLQSHQHGVQAVITPQLDDFSAFVADPAGDWVDVAGTWTQVPAGTGTHSQGPFYQEADLVFVSHPDGTWEAFDGAGVDISAALAPAVTVTNTYDARQAEGSSDYLQMATIDLSQVAALGHYPSNGLCYCYGSAEGTGTELAGFQFGQAEDLAGDLTLVSPDAIYLQGNFNSVSQHDTAVMADAVNLLSNNWDNSKSPGNLPSATETTFNVSILTGDLEATASAFNGGPHNLVRMHENWSGVNLNIEGSLVCIGHSERATGAFAVQGDYYEAPNRNWSFDLDLVDAANLPPYTPMIVDVSTLAIW